LFDERIKEFSKYELKKTPEDLEILKKSETIVNNIVARYGGRPKALPIDNIYILKPGSILTITGGRFSGGIHRPIRLKIGVEKGESKLLFASTFGHELFHLKSYKSARIDKLPVGLHVYRSGLSMYKYDRKNSNEGKIEEKEYFAMLEEAIISECTIKFIEEISKDPILKEEAEAIRKFKDWIVAYYLRIGTSREEKVREFERELKYITDPQSKVEKVLAFSTDEEKRQEYATKMLNELFKERELEEMERYKERKNLYELLDKLVVSSNGKFKSRDEVFKEFAEANFSGNYLHLARIIESILGKGSFRKLAEEFSETRKI